MKRSLSLFLSLVIALGVCLSAPFALEVNAATVDDLTFTLNDDGQSYYVSDCTTSASGELVIPSTYEGLPVTSIGVFAFNVCTSLADITIPNSVTSIGDNAFFNCTSLTNITIPDSVTSIGVRAFHNTGYYNESSNWENDVLYIGNHLIGVRTQSVTSYEIKNGTITIADYAFADCNLLTSVAIPNSVTSIGKYAFENCYSLTSITIPDSVTRIGEYAFDFSTVIYGCGGSYAENYAVENGYEFCDENTVNDWVDDTDENMNDKSWYVPGRECFSVNANAYSEQIISYNGPGGDIIVSYFGASEISSNAFAEQSDITSVKISAGIESIGAGAFSGCTSLKSVYIPRSVTYIAPTAFDDCPSLVSIEIYSNDDFYGNYPYELPCCTCEYISTFVPFCQVHDIDYNENEFYTNGVHRYVSNDGVLYLVKKYPEARLEQLEVSLLKYPEGKTKFTITSAINEISPYVFSDVTESVTSLVISEDATDISVLDYLDLTKLDTITVSGNNEYYIVYDGILFNKLKTKIIKVPIGRNIKTYTIPDTVTSICSEAFSGCTSLASITIPNSVTSIGSSAFSGCTALTTVTIPDSVTSIGSYAFYNTGYYNNNSNWENDVLYIGNHLIEAKDVLSGDYIIKEGIKCIPNYAFSDCASLTSVTIPNSVTSIGSSAFSGCTSLVNVTIPSSVTSIGRYVFENCTSLSGINITDLAAWCDMNFDSQYENPLYYAKNLYLNGELVTELVIPEGVTEIKKYAFSNCESLTSITIPNSVTSIGSSAFSGCTSFSNVTIPSSVTSMGRSVFENCTSLSGINVTDLSAWCNINFGSQYENPLYYAKNLYLNGELVTELVIPESATEIKDYTFYNCASLTSVTIPDSVTSIGSSAFSGCTSLANVTIPSSITSIGRYVFENCTSLSGINVTDLSAWCNINFGSQYENPLYYAKNLYLNSELITELVIPEGVTEIKNYAFSNCESLTSITIPNSVTSIGSSAFSGCTSLANVTIPSSVTSMGRSVFENCTSLSGINITDLSAWCNINFGSQYENPLYYAKNLYLNGELITELVIPEGVTEIKDYAFYNCDSITSVTVSDGVTSIGNAAFSNCNSLTNAIIPNSVTNIGSSAFNDCKDLVIKGYENSYVHTYATENGIEFQIIGDAAETSYLEFELNSDKNSYCVSGYKTGISVKVTIPDTYNGLPVTSIGSKVFCDCTSLTSVTISDSVTSIEEEAFSGCTALKSITIGDSVNSIGSSAFKNCTSLTSITLPDGVTSIGSSAFSNCTSLTSITIPDSVTSIGSSAFSGCTALKSITIGDSVNSIGSSAFKNCTSLTRVMLPNGITNIASSTFFNCDSLTSITIPDSVTSIGVEAFYGCSSLESITLPDSITSIGDSAFNFCGISAVYITAIESWCNIDFGDMDANPLYYAKNLYLNGELVTKLVIPEGVTKIKNYAFYNCDSLSSVTLPDSVTSIGEEAFEGCTSLANITIPDNVTSIGSSAFSNCTSLTRVTLPNGITNIASSTFWSCTSLTSVTIPDSVTNIGVGAFYNTGYYNNTNNWENDVLYIGNYLVEAKTSLSGDYVIKTGTKCIADEIFYNCKSLNSVTIPGSVKSITNEAFYGCSSLTSVTVGDGITSIGESAFSSCTSLVSIAVPDSVTSIGESAFNSCTSLASVTIPDSMMSIGDYAFRNCTSLTNIVIPVTVNSIIGRMAFYNTAYYNNSDNWENNVLYIGNYLIEAKTLISGDCIIKSGTEFVLDYAFANCTFLTSITIPDSVKSIGVNAFIDCDSLTALYITDVSAWCNIDFKSKASNPLYYSSNCYNSLYLNGDLVTELVIPEGVTTITDYAFYNCNSFEKITIPDSVASIGASSFDSCYNLIFLVSPASCAYEYVLENNFDAIILGGATVGDLQFTLNNDGVSYKCTGFVKFEFTETVIPEIYNGLPVTGISYYAFNGCTSLTSITIPDGVTSISDGAFEDCTSLTSITLPDSVISIGKEAFYNTGYYNDSSNWDNDVLYIGNHLIKAKVTLSGEYTVKSGTICIADMAFGEYVYQYTDEDGAIYYQYFGCEDLTSVIIPDGLIGIGEEAFYYCDSLANIKIPDSVISIDDSAFNQSHNLLFIVDCGSYADEYVQSKGFKYTYENMVFELNDDGASYSVVDCYEKIVGDLVIPAKYNDLPVTSIGEKAFYECELITSVTIPGTVTNIGWGAFGGCISLARIDIPNSVTSVGHAAFCDTAYYNDTNNWENDVLYIGNYLISARMSLSGSCVIKEGTTYITDTAFEDCNKLTKVVLPESVISIGVNAFGYCYSLSDIIIPDSVIRIAGGAFTECDSLTSITLPKNLEIIEGYTFESCNSLSKIAIPEKVKRICKNAFWYCTALKSVEFSKSVSIIDESAFAGCSALECVTLPNGVKHIGSFAFAHTPSLTTITIPKTVISMGENVFYDSQSLKYVFYTGSISAWGNINIGDNNTNLISTPIHYNATGHSHSCSLESAPTEQENGKAIDTCPVCGFINGEEDIVYINDHITSVDTKNAVVDTTSNTLLLDMSACKDINEAIVEMDGYTLTTTPISDYGFIGTGSKLQVADSTGTQVAEYTLVVRGDVNGDSVCDSIDLMLIELARHESNNVTLEGAYFTAANLAEDSEINIDDFNAVVNKAVA